MTRPDETPRDMLDRVDPKPALLVKAKTSRLEELDWMRRLLVRYMDDLEGRTRAVLDSGNVDDFRALATSRATAKEVIRAVDERVAQVNTEPEEETPTPPDPGPDGYITRQEDAMPRGAALWRDGAAFEAAAARVRDADRRDWT